MKPREKSRLDRLVVANGLAPTREKARRLIIAGEVLVNEVPVEKPGAMVGRESKLRLRNEPAPFVSRGGEKLQGALDELGLEVKGFRVLDIGASTGGFTDCLLQRGASEVTALDVGKGQLDWKLRSDPRVKIIEGVNARYLRPETFPARFDLITIDVSFISLSKILPAAAPLVKEQGKLLALVKPQFELTRNDVEKGGIVRDPSKHWEAILKVIDVTELCGLSIEAVAASPITGLEGNREFFVLMRLGGRAGLALDAVQARAREICGLE
jgi:23S rRNA (cytidine1920-2'-O)/16S rRNA (cytidine1409-2'-O)-methyltransferase